MIDKPRPGWDFDYRVLVRPNTVAEREGEFVVAATQALRPQALTSALLTEQIGATVQPVLERAPLFWYRLQTSQPQRADSLQAALAAQLPQVRYVCSAAQGSLGLGPRLEFSQAKPARAADWPVHTSREHPEQRRPGDWFLHAEAGVDVQRSVCGTGAGTRLAVIDDEGRDADALDLDREIALPEAPIPRGSSHGAAMVGWAVRSRGRSADRIPPFIGVAPDASPRLYCIPKPDAALPWLPCAIVRAVDDGADVVVCATYIDGMNSPMLDDALEFALRLGRGGLGAAVVFPAGREISSPPGALRPSLTLGLHEPASDPRVLCAAPSGRDGAWFLWTDKRGRKKPFSNRGPALRIAAPGDDMAYPFARDDRQNHAESSGASAIAAGVALLVLSTNPSLTVSELYAVLSQTTRPCDPRPHGVPDADPADLRPCTTDPDRHDSKCGYGRLSAARACCAAADPVAAALVELGEDLAATRFCEAVARQPHYSANFARWSARCYRADPILSHGLRTLLRHMRLISQAEQRAHLPGALIRAITLAFDRLGAADVPAALSAELHQLRERLLATAGAPERANCFEARLQSFASALWSPPA